jgi:two-component system OmpR family sensor kinase
MPAEVAARVTERFYRADPARSRGSGLGLAIVGAHGGAVEIDSAPGSGTTVRITLPIASTPAASSHPIDPSAGMP